MIGVMTDLSRELGMSRPITRRDFLDGVATATAATTFGLPGFAPESGSGRPRAVPERHAPPPALEVRGSTPDAVAVPHALRDGRFWPYAGTPEPTGEEYDLVVVGAGISGLTSAYRWLRRDPAARVLILDNHDEIGGQARRNTFRPQGRAGPLIAPGGSREGGAFSVYGPEGRDLLRDLGIRSGEPDFGLYPGLGMHDGVYCDRESFGREHLVVLSPERAVGLWAAELPVAERARREIVRLYAGPPDWLPGLSEPEKEERLAGMTYAGFLRDVCGVHPDVLRFVRTMPSAEFGYGADALGALDAWAMGYPGFDGLGLDRGKPSRYLSSLARARWEEPLTVHAPGGAQALVALMVSRMVPGFACADDATEYNYEALDRPANPVRIRLSSPVVMAGNDSGGTVTVGYFDGHRVRTVRAAAAIMACWHMVIPYLISGLPADQRAAMRQAVKLPVISASVQVRDWTAWLERGISRVRFTGAYWQQAELATPVAAGAYRPPADPRDPAVIHLTRVPTVAGLPPAEGAAAGRRELIRTPYDYLEYSLREQLARLLAPAGFDPARDIEAIVVNRWGHGYAPDYTRPWHPFHPDSPTPAETARRPFGRIAMANADAVPSPSVDAAITAAYRAVDALTR